MAAYLQGCLSIQGHQNIRCDAEEYIFLKKMAVDNLYDF